MKDAEFIKLKNNFLKAVLVTIIFIIPFSIFIYNRFSPNNSPLLKNIKAGNNTVIFISSNNCSKCKKIKAILDKNNVAYFELNKDKNSDFTEIMYLIDFSTKYVDSPGIIYVEKGTLKANIMNTNEELAQNFIESHNLVDTNN